MLTERREPILSLAHWVATVPVGIAVDVQLAGVLHQGAGLVGLPLGGGDVHLLQNGLGTDAQC